MPATVTATSADVTLPLYDTEGPLDATKAVVVVQEAFGVNDHIEDVCGRFAAEGFRAVAPHLFHRSGDPVLGYSDFERVMPHMQALNEAGLVSDLGATFDYLSQQGFDSASVGIVGFCMGGTVAFLAAARYKLGAAVTFYGGGVTQGRFGMPSLVEAASELQTPWLGLFGDLDQGIPVEDVETLRGGVRSASVPTEIVRYPDAEHGFHCDARPSYHRSSALDAWRRTLAWFESHLRSTHATGKR
jgi:carboxymethylenebutenolidase